MLSNLPTQSLLGREAPPSTYVSIRELSHNLGYFELFKKFDHKPVVTVYHHPCEVVFNLYLQTESSHGARQVARGPAVPPISGIISAEWERFQLPPQTQQQGTLEAEAATLRCLPTELTCILCHSLAVPS